jgi:hypothetical protein
MADWTIAAVSAGSVVVGSLLAYGQQALTDRRIARREQESRRENFRIQNFEVHKDALLEIQQLLAEFSRKTKSENIRRKEVEHEFFNKDFWGKLRSGPEQVKEEREKLAQFSREFENSPDSETRRQFERESKKLADFTIAWSEQFVGTMNEFTDILNGRTAYMRSIGEFIEKLRLGMYRSGSNAVINAGEDYISSLIKWTDEIPSKVADESMSRVRTGELALHRAISNALAKGPFDRYKHELPSEDGDN